MSYQSEVLADSPLAWWKLDDAPASTSVLDHSGNGRHGTVTGTPLLGTTGNGTPNTGGQAMFVGASSAGSVNVPDAVWNDIAGPFTLEAWAVISGSSEVYLAEKYDGPGFSGYVLRVSSNIITAYTLNGQGADSIEGGSLPAGAAVAHIVFSFDGTQGRLLVNGTQRNVKALRVPSAGVGPLRLGARGDDGAPSGGLYLSNVALYGAALSNERAAAHYEAGIVAAPAGAITGTVPVSAPAHTVALTGTATAGPATGALASAGPAHAAALTGSAAAGPVSGSLTAVAPAHAAALGGGVPVDPASSVLFAVGPAPVAALAGRTPVVLLPWRDDDSQRAHVAIEATAGSLVVLPPLAPLPTLPGGETIPDPDPGDPGTVGNPALIWERPITRCSHRMPTPTPDAFGRVRNVGDYDIETNDDFGGVFGKVRLFINGRDVTYFRGAPVRIGEMVSSQPGGDETCQLDFPQLTAFDVPGQGDLKWLRPDAPVSVDIIRPDNTRWNLFTGHLVSDNAGHSQSGVQCGWHAEGTIAQADSVGHRVPTMLEPTDIGRLIADSLNGVVSRRYGAVKRVTTGIPSQQRGAYGDTEWDYVQHLLSTAWPEEGQQWTLARTPTPGLYKIRPKFGPDTIHWTLSAGAPGVDINLSADQAEVVNAVYGRGVGPDGYSWANWKYPNLRADDAPAYPYASAGQVMSIGSTDAGTLTGEGVSVWQERARELGYRLAVDGVFSGADADTARAIQRRYGLSVDGIVGPQTWAATHAVGADSGCLDGSYRAPLAINPKVEPNLYAANGAVTGPNPQYDRSVLRRERDIDFGPGVTKKEAAESARREVARDSTPGWTGTIVLHTDPWEGYRFAIVEGQNIKVLGWRGQDVVVHVVEISKNLDDLSVRLTVDTKARDQMTLSAVRTRDRDAKADPARRPGNVNRRSRQEQDAVVEFDGESGAGVIPKHAIYGGLWTVIRIPVSQLGRIAKVDVKTSGPKARFAFALFGAPIQPSHLARYVGDPLAKDNPFEAHADTLTDRFGFIEGWGQKGQACGYWPGQEDKKSTLTGRLVDTGGLEYVSEKPPWVWVAEYSPTSTFISGRLWPAPVQ